MTMPNFLIIGFEKAGTTSVYHYLKQHPEIFVSPTKETNFFIYEGQNPKFLPYVSEELLVAKSLGAYRALFQDVAAHKAIGEASPLYLADPHAPEAIRRYIPEAKLIALLRDPVERAYSAYWMQVRDSRETRSFEQAVEEELAGRLDDSLEIGRRHYVRWGLYARHLKPYLGSFDRSQLAIYLFDDLKADPGGLMRELFRFLDVDDRFRADTSVRYNASGAPSSSFLKPLFGKSTVTRTLKRALPGPLGRRAVSIQEAWRSRALAKPPMPQKLRRKLVAGYRSDILELQGMIGRDLSRWLE
jgi:Sulfotransferase domain